MGTDEREGLALQKHHLSLWGDRKQRRKYTDRARRGFVTYPRRYLVWDKNRRIERRKRQGLSRADIQVRNGDNRQRRKQERMGRIQGASDPGHVPRMESF